jgi:hypothetical protein
MGFGKGSDFSRAAKSFKIGRAFAPEVGFLLPKRVLPQPVRRCPYTNLPKLHRHQKITSLAKSLPRPKAFGKTMQATFSIPATVI